MLFNLFKWVQIEYRKINYFAIENFYFSLSYFVFKSILRQMVVYLFEEFKLNSLIKLLIGH